MAPPGPPTMYQITPVRHHRSSTNKQHSICHTKSHTMVRRLKICNWRLQQKLLSTVTENIAIMAQGNHTKPI